MSRALIAMSGGVDSSVAARLAVDMGHECIGCTMTLFDNEEMLSSDALKSCCSADTAEDARHVALSLGMPFYAFNFKKDFREKVIEDFASAYASGRTPNPCIECNRHLKFGKLLERADILGCDYLVTGHYARIKEVGGEMQLLKGLDDKKDQSYVLYMLSQKQLRRLILPLGELTKPRVRIIAQENAFVNAERPESQDICFIPDGDYCSFLERNKGMICPEGDFVDREGNVLGRHRGIIHYTVGQRRGLGISSSEPWYVLAIDAAADRVVLGRDSELYERTVHVRDISHTTAEPLKERLRCSGKIRYHHREQPGTLYMEDDGWRFEFDEVQRAVTPGQHLVLYEGERVLGGGRII